MTPHTPIGWEGWEIERLRVGEACFDVRSERISPSQARYTLRTDAAGWQVGRRDRRGRKAPAP